MRQTKKVTSISITLFILIVAVLAFIFGNSLESISESQEKSGGILNFIKPFLEPIFGIGKVTDHLVRKLAHFIEFGVLGALVASYAAVVGKLRLQSVVNCLSFGLAAAVIDESLQLISARGSQVQDILLDFSGVSAGIAIVLLGYTIIVHRVRKQKSKP